MLGDQAIGLVIRQQSSGIRVLTDAEATVYLASRQNRNVMDIGRTHFRQQHVDTSKLTDDEQASHHRRLSRSAAYVQALTATTYQRLPTANKNDKPAEPGALNQ
jgi:hypothetical protein